MVDESKEELQSRGGGTGSVLCCVNVSVTYFDMSLIFAQAAFCNIFS